MLGWGNWWVRCWQKPGWAGRPGKVPESGLYWRVCSLGRTLVQIVNLACWYPLSVIDHTCCRSFLLLSVLQIALSTILDTAVSFRGATLNLKDCQYPTILLKCFAMLIYPTFDSLLIPGVWVVALVWLVKFSCSSLPVLVLFIIWFFICATLWSCVWVSGMVAFHLVDIYFRHCYLLWLYVYVAGSSMWFDFCFGVGKNLFGLVQPQESSRIYFQYSAWVGLASAACSGNKHHETCP